MATTQTNNGTVAGPVKLTVDCELMVNNSPSKAVDATHPIQVAEDGNGNPMIFSVGTPDVNTGQDTFYAILNQPGQSTGWQQYDLSSGLGAGITVDAFAVSQSSNGQITLALAFETAAAPGVSRFYITGPLSNDPTQPFWQDFTSQWVARPNPASVLVDKIIMGTSDDGFGTPPILAATKQAGADDSYWVVDSNTADTNPAGFWTQYALPEDSQNLMDIALGSLPMPFGRGVYVLYQVGPSLSLVFQTLAPNPFGKTYNINLVAPANAAALCPVSGSDGSTDLYVAGDGLFVFSAATQAGGASPAATTIYDSTTAPGLKDLNEIIVATAPNNISIWAKGNQEVLQHQAVLQYVAGATGATPNWSFPVGLLPNVAQIAPLLNQAKGANEIFVVDNKNNLSYLWQDPTTTVWQQTDIPLADTGAIQSFPCYTSHINLLDAKNCPITNAPVNITASAWTYVTINGGFYELGGEPVAITPDALGNITIINKVSTISTPVFHLQAEFLPQIADINPAYKVIGGFEVLECLALLGLYIAILCIQMADDDNDQNEMDLFDFFPNLFNSLGTGVGGIGKVITDLPTAQAMTLIGAGGLYAIGGGLDFVSLIVDCADDLPHDI